MTIQPSSAELDAVFGVESRGASPEERSITSVRMFVRSQVQLAVASPRATGIRLTARWAFHLFGYELLRNAVYDGAAAIVPDRSEPAATLRRRREELGLTIQRIARSSNLREEDLVAAETPGRISPVQQLHHYAQALGLDDEYLGFEPGARADEELGVRLRQFGNKVGATLSQRLVLKLAEAAWVISRQDELSGILGLRKQLPDQIVPSNDYRSEVWRRGFELAERTRVAFGLDAEEPIPSMRALIDEVGIPLVQAELGEHFAGATVANRDTRGIVVNVEGMNANVWVRRTTVAHELGHMLWDPVQKLRKLHVDSYDEISNPGKDPVETRANAFAIAFLAPPSAVRKIVAGQGDATDKVARVMEIFGIAATGASYHVANVSRDYGDPIDTTHLDLSRLPRPATELEASESWTVDFFPLASVPISRRGRFAPMVAKATMGGVIALDSAASWLGVDTASLENRIGMIAEL